VPSYIRQCVSAVAGLRLLHLFLYLGTVGGPSMDQNRLEDRAG
jgi:hypothetical protein